VLINPIIGSLSGVIDVCLALLPRQTLFILQTNKEKPDVAISMSMDVA
jgi:hypothetical protein